MKKNEQRLSREHTFYECPPNCEDLFCKFCRGGLAMCTTCGAAEGELLEECPGRKLSAKELEYCFKNGCLDEVV